MGSPAVWPLEAGLTMLNHGSYGVTPEYVRTRQTELRARMDADPVRFFKSVIMPLLPRESRLAFDHAGVIEWRSLLGAGAEASVEANGGWQAAGGDGSRGLLGGDVSRGGAESAENGTDSED